MALPWTWPDPRKPRSTGYLDCVPCQKGNGPQVRAAMHCGYVPRATWPPGKLRVICGPEPYAADVCPGWLVRQPIVGEATAAHAAADAGVTCNPLDLRPINQAVVILKRAVAMREAELLKPEPGRPT